MPNKKHLDILKQGIKVWNNWRDENRDIRPDLRVADLHDADLHDTYLIAADLHKANLREANLRGADLHEVALHDADLHKANLREANLIGALLGGADLTSADLTEANLGWANLYGANLTKTNLVGATLLRAILTRTNLSEADLTKADLTEATLIETNLTKTNLSKSSVAGISAWDLTLQNTIQTDLSLSLYDEPIIAVDNLALAQLIFLLLHNKKIRQVIDPITSNAVLILGRFAPERGPILDALREELRKRNYTPILFDFEKPGSQGLTETIMTLAAMARFVIADLSDPNTIPLEIMSFAEKLLSVPVQAIFCSVPKIHEKPYPMYEHLRYYPHVLPIYEYESQEQLIAVLGEKVIQPAEDKVKAMQPGN